MPSNHSYSSSAHPLSPAGAPVLSDSSPPHTIVSPTESTRSIQSAPSAPETALTDGSADPSPRASLYSNETFGGHWSLQPSHPLLHGHPDSDNDSFMSAQSFAARNAARNHAPPNAPRVLSMSAFHGGDREESEHSSQSASPRAGSASPLSSRTPPADSPDLVQTRSGEHRDSLASETFRSISKLYTNDPARTLEALKRALQDLSLEMIPRERIQEWEATLKGHAEQVRRLTDDLARATRERDHVLMHSRELEQMASASKETIESLEENLRQADNALLTSQERLSLRQCHSPAKCPNSGWGRNYVDPRYRDVPSEEVPARLTGRLP